MKCVLLIVSLLGFMALTCHAQCSIAGTWQDLPFQTNPESLSDPDGTPVGFATETFPGTDNVDFNPVCVQVNFPSGSLSIRYMYVLVSAPGSRICAGIENMDAMNCGDDEFAFCEINVPNSFRVEFSCDSSCDQNDFSFRYRVVLESREVDDEFFCNNINETYPSSLFMLPPPTVDSGVNPATNPFGGANILSPLLLSTLLLITLLALLFSH